LRFTGEGEIFFIQKRVGNASKPFQLYKFATMLKDSPNIGTGTVTLREDPRILPVGQLLRKTKINELPQLFNILNGDMSVIGPRPQTQRCFDAFPAKAREAIIKVRPGLSGIGSIVFRDEERMMDGHQDPDHFYDYVIMPYKGQLEVWFVKHQGALTYFSLILITIWVVVFPKSQIVWSFFKSLPIQPGELAPFFSNSLPTE
jgi:lipopolysaccharide/colanic/teichoic acid biosynthesis glycosyltransferase